MNSRPAASRAHFGLPLALRLALRDLRGGLAGFGIFLACIALGVAAIVGVGSVSHGLTDGLAREGRQILGGDAAFSLIHRELDPAERAWLSARGSVSAIATLRAMARRADGHSALVEIKAVDATYPVAGEVVLDPPQNIGRPARRRVTASTASSPTRRSPRGSTSSRAIACSSAMRRSSCGPLSFPNPTSSPPASALVRVSSCRRQALRATGLLQPGVAGALDLSRFAQRGDAGQPISDAGVGRFVAAAGEAFPQAGWEVRTRSDVSPQFADDLRRFTQFLTLVGLTALIVGGVGVANAVRAFIDRKRPDLATLKSLGATGFYVFGVMLTQVMIIALLGIAIGLAIGAALPFVIVGGFGSLIPLPLEAALYPGELAAGAAYGASDGARLFARAARPRPRCFGLGAVPGRDRARSRAAARPLPRHDRRRRRGPRRHRSSLLASERSAGAPLLRGDARRLRCAAARRRGGDGARRPPAACPTAWNCGSPSPISIAPAR